MPSFFLKTDLGHRTQKRSLMDSHKLLATKTRPQLANKSHVRGAEATSTSVECRERGGDQGPRHTTGWLGPSSRAAETKNKHQQL